MVGADDFFTSYTQWNILAKFETFVHRVTDSRFFALKPPDYHYGDIQGEVIGARRHCHEAGGMEIPSRLSVTGNQKIVEKLKQLIIALNSPSI